MEQYCSTHFHAHEAASLGKHVFRIQNAYLFIDCTLIVRSIENGLEWYAGEMKNSDTRFHKSLHYINWEGIHKV